MDKQFVSEYTNVIFPKNTISIGRNGLIKTSGVEIHLSKGGSFEGLIDLHPLTSKGIAANCRISIPLDEIPSFISSLNELYIKSTE